jgi:small conductance mechanosensitive channel
MISMEIIKMYGLMVLKAIIVLWIGFKVIKLINNVLLKTLDKKGVDPSLKTFLSSLTGIILKVALILSVTEIVGIKTTSFIAILGAAGLAVGMSLQGALGNFAGGVMILLFKPFKVGDVIEAQGFTGSVKEIQIFCTILNTPDKKTIILPNGSLSSGSIVNYSIEPIRRVDMTFGIGYDDDLKTAKETLQSLVDADSRILKDPESAVLVSELADSSVNFAVRVHVKAEDYWGVYFDFQEKVKLTFDEKKISIPYPQQELHVHQVVNPVQ